MCPTGRQRNIKKHIDQTQNCQKLQVKEIKKSTSNVSEGCVSPKPEKAIRSTGCLSQL
jgi:hypothetical protein